MKERTIGGHAAGKDSRRCQIIVLIAMHFRCLSPETDVKKEGKPPILNNYNDNYNRLSAFMKVRQFWWGHKNDDGYNVEYDNLATLART